jgi:2-hydroxy-6-oxonona-2,4-dienedioate hydrolase
VTRLDVRAEAGAPTERSVRTEVDGHRLHARAWTTGERPTVVLVHGMVVSSRYLVPIAERLVSRLDVWAPDQPGFGESEGHDVEPRPGPLAVALVAWMDAIGLDRVSLLGNSFGCQVATELAMRWPDRVDRLVLSSPTTDPTARSVVSQLARFRREATQSNDLRRVMRTDYRAAGVRRALATFRAVRDDRLEDRLPYVTVPTLVVRGTDDPIVPRPWAEEVTRLLPHAQLVELEGMPHAMVHDGADALAAAALPFLTEES